MDGAFIDEIELNNYIEKLKCYRNIQEENISEIKKFLNKILQYYITSNTSDYNFKKGKTVNELDILQSNLNKYIYVLEKIIIKYQLLAKETNRKFENIGGVNSNEWRIKTKV